MAKKKIIDRYENWKKFFSEDIWNIDIDDLSRMKASMIKQLKVVIITIKNLGQKDMGWKAVALSFFTTMSFIPFIAVLLAVTSKLGLSDYFIKLLHDNFDNTEIINLVITFSDNIIKTASEGPYGLISSLVFVWLIIWLMLCIERVFNEIWTVEVSRVVWKRLLTYFGILLLSPFVLIIFLSMTLSITDGVNTLGIEIPFLESVSKVILWTLFYGIVILVFTTLYVLVPSIKVRLVPALKSAIISAFAFTIIQYFYLETQLFVSRMNAVYGVFAAIPLFMVWLNMGWFVILIGSEISYALQNVDKYSSDNIKLKK